MPSPIVMASAVQQKINEAIAEAKEVGRKSVAAVARPARLQKAADGATRAGQVIAALLLPVVIMVNLTIIEVINQLMGNVLGAGTIEAGQISVVAFLVTGITLALLIISAWGWFQFVRTAAFGGISLD